MPLSKPALMSAFLCPGVGQWVAGKRALGAALIAAAVASAGSPFAVFIVGLFWRQVGCDRWSETLWQCDVRMIGTAWHRAWPVALVGLPLFAVVWAVAVAHANRLTLPAARRTPG